MVHIMLVLSMPCAKLKNHACVKVLRYISFERSVDQVHNRADTPTT